MKNGIYPYLNKLCCLPLFILVLCTGCGVKMENVDASLLDKPVFEYYILENYNGSEENITFIKDGNITLGVGKTGFEKFIKHIELLPKYSTVYLWWYYPDVPISVSYSAECMSFPYMLSDYPVMNNRNNGTDVVLDIIKRKQIYIITRFEVYTPDGKTIPYRGVKVDIRP